MAGTYPWSYLTSTVLSGEFDKTIYPTLGQIGLWLSQFSAHRFEMEDKARPVIEEGPGNLSPIL